MLKKKLTSQGGFASTEFALVLPILVVMAFATLDIGRMIFARSVVANVSREGGSLASREIKSGPDLAALLQASGTPLDLNAEGKIYISGLAAGQSGQSSDPTCTDGTTSGGLADSEVVSPCSEANFGLAPGLYNRLVFDEAQQTADISELTVVKVYYAFEPITPVFTMMGSSILNVDKNGDSTDDSILLSSTSIF